MTKEDHTHLMEKFRGFKPIMQWFITLWAEARGECEEGIYAVANVIKLRQSDELTWNDIDDPYQFSCFNLPLNKRRELLFNRLFNINIYADKPQQLLEQVSKVMHGNVGDFSQGADHYCTLNSHPYWERKFYKTVEIGNHKFFDSKRNPDGTKRAS